jgi:5-methylthioadenosine/S-adenosylhomocysteine deaminase
MILHRRRPVMASREAPNCTLFKGGLVLSLDPKVGDHACADVLVAGDRIVAVSPDLTVEEAQVIDVAGMIVMPGLVNAHQHAWLGLLRGLMPNVDAIGDYMTAIPQTLGRFYTPEDSGLATRLTALSSLDAGVTTLLDACHNTRSPAHSDAAISAFETTGLRVLHMVGKPLDRWPETWPGDVERLAIGREAMENLVRVGVFAQPDSMETSMPLARRLGLRILTEYAGPGSVITEMHEKGLLEADNIFNHCTRLTDGEWQLLKMADAHVTVNPRSDALFGFEAGGFPFQAAIDHGLKPALGVDIDTSMSGDMFAEMRTAFFQQRSVVQAQRVLSNRATPAAVTVRAILEATTVNSAACLGLADQIGTLTPGKQADIIAIRTDGIAVYPSHNAIGTVVHMIDRADVQEVMVAGRLRKHAGRLLDVDLSRLHAETDAARAHLFEAAGYIPNAFEERFPQLQAAA